ncbi:MAG: DUF3866 family protein [Gaiella sp.]
MPIGLRWGMVTSVADGIDGVGRADVEGEPCLVVHRLTGPVQEGDTVLVNQAAGPGAESVIAVNLTRGLRLPAIEEATGLAWPATPAQHAIRLAEDELAGLPDRLDALAVVCCASHDQVVPTCAALRGRRVGYVQLGGGALPVSLSEGLRALRARHVLEVAIAVAPCVDGDLHCLTPASGLAVAAARGVDVAVVSVGPGAATTRARFGDGGLSVAGAAAGAAALGAAPIVAPIVTHHDPTQPEGLSGRTLALLALCGRDVRVAWPGGLPHPVGVAVHEVDVSGWREACSGLPLSCDGRGPDDEPWFFAAAYAAGALALG